jgi:hypothetical protein
MSQCLSFDAEVNALLEARANELQRLSFAEVAAMPKAKGSEMVVAGQRCTLTAFV